MIRPRALFLASVLGLAVSVCGAWRPAWAGGLEAFAGLSGELVVSGSEVGLPLAMALAERVQRDHPAVSVRFSLPGIADGYKELLDGDSALFLSDRDAQGFVPGNRHPRFVPVAVDPVALAVHPSNTVSGVSLAQARDLFRGRIGAWAQLGGLDKSVLAAFVNVPGVADAPPAWNTPAVASQSAMRVALTRTPTMAGYLSLRDLDASVKPLTLDGVYPDMRAFASGDYRVYRMLYAVLPEKPSPLAQAFADCLAGPVGQELAHQVGYAPLEAQPREPSLLPVGLPDLMARAG